MTTHPRAVLAGLCTAITVWANPLPGHIHPKLRSAQDNGRVSRAQILRHITVALSSSDAQKTDLDTLLKQQQDPTSPNFHKWLTPEQYADRFGATESDLSAVSDWLRSEGLTVESVGRGRTWIAVSGAAPQVEQAFQTEIHSYTTAEGETHFANATEPSVPDNLRHLVKHIRGLNDFRMKPAKRAATAKYTSTKGSHYLSPDDFATIYNISPLYSQGVDGTGQKMVIAGQTRINVSDIQSFRTRFGLPANDPQPMLVPNTRDPGISKDDLSEADLDIEWAGATARNATILYVYSYDVMDAVQYAIDQNLAPVVSTSYGSCELENTSADIATLQSWARQGNAQGITWLSASGDYGAADCGDTRNPGLAVDLPGSIPEVTSVGGTTFKEGAGNFWNSTTTPTGASVRGYIPETAWNDSDADGEPASTGGGASAIFAKPAWQLGTGVPDDAARHVPDVSFAASADHDGYLVYTSGALDVYGGTSAPTPAFAGMTVLLNQALNLGGLGNINPQLYALAQSSPAAFHDVADGNNIVTVPCARRSKNCVATPVGFNAATAYDQATGLGSLDLSVLLGAWAASTTASTPVSQ